ncbi:hypothetical protein B1Q96_19800 [Salmonella enterica]|nr:hypothetical protein [Salmonella enterica]
MKILLYATGMAPARVFRSRGGDFALTGRQGNDKDNKYFSRTFSPEVIETPPKPGLGVKN